MAKKKEPAAPAKQTNAKTEQLAGHTADGSARFLTTNTGLKIADDQNSLKAGERGATLLEDFILREKITHFDHERIPERVVHARGSGAHGVFKLYKPIPQYTKAAFLNDTETETPVFVRFSTVAGSKGSTDLARDVRGFAVKFYTQEGNFDLVGNNMPVFFIQDAVKFPDLIHAVKPEPDNEIPQAASAHDTFWDFISMTPESAHMIMWVMSDRALPRSYRMMEGFGVHSFRFVNENGEAHFVKFHWKPLLGVHSVAWDEAQIISGKDTDFHRRDLFEAIESGAYPEWELGIQVVPQSDEHKYDFDLLDSTKLIPEELVPVQRIGKMTLNRNPDNFFAETEQVAYHLGHVVPGIDFTNDPLLQGRLFSYTDTQLSRLGGPNFQEIPINRPISPLHNNQRDGHMRQTIDRGKTSYGPNGLNGNDPRQTAPADGGYQSYPERIDARKVRARSQSFLDHFSQARLFFNSQSEPEQNHIIDALSFELGKVKSDEVRTRMLAVLRQIDDTLVQSVADALGLPVPQDPVQLNYNVPAGADPKDYASQTGKSAVQTSDALSMKNTLKKSIATRKIALLVADGTDNAELEAIQKTLIAEGAVPQLVAPRMSFLPADKKLAQKADESFLTAASVLFDAVYVPGGKDAIAKLAAMPDAVHFLNQAYKHCKAIGATQDATDLFARTYFYGAKEGDKATDGAGVILNGKGKTAYAPFIEAVAQHRNWEREPSRKVPA